MDIEAFKESNRRILGVIDELGIHREGVMILLDAQDEGQVRLPTPSRIEITPPAPEHLDAFLVRLPSLLRSLDLSRVPRADEE
jgi:hypothetical protein